MKNKLLVLAFLLLVPMIAYSKVTFDKTPSNTGMEERLANIKSAELLDELLKEAKKTNKLLEQLVQLQGGDTDQAN